VTEEARVPLSKAKRALLFAEHQGKCCLCGERIEGAAWIDEHIEPLWRLGTNAWDNRGPAHVECAREKTRLEAKARAKCRRIAARAEGRKRKSRPIPGSKASCWKKGLNGKVVRRREHEL
jgi:5-methylcytosine-specific restriction endonuclease McrA